MPFCTQEERDFLDGLATSKSMKLTQKVEGTTGLSIPLPLSSPAFKAVWEQWLVYRRARKVTMLTMTLQRQLLKLAAVGETEAIATIERSIDNGWTGLFPDKRVDKSIRGTAEAKRAAEAMYQRTQKILAESRPPKLDRFKLTELGVISKEKP